MPQQTTDLLIKLRGLVEVAREKKLAPQDILEQLAEVNPDFATKLKALGGWRSAALILLLLWMIKSFELQVKVDLNWLIDQARHFGQHDDAESYFDSAPPQFPSDPIRERKRESPAPNIADHAPNRLKRQARRRTAAQQRRKRDTP